MRLAFYEARCIAHEYSDKGEIANLKALWHSTGPFWLGKILASTRLDCDTPISLGVTVNPGRVKRHYPAQGDSE